MTLEVWTARISTRDPDRYSVARKGGDSTFAPSWDLLNSLMKVRQGGHEETPEEWRAYVEKYLAEMTQSYKRRRTAWNNLLARKRVVLTCYCTNPDRCHRRVLAAILTKLGAEDRGELPNP